MRPETPLDRLYVSARTLAIIWACGVSFAGGLIALSEFDDRVRSRTRVVDRIRHIEKFETEAYGRVAVIDYAGDVRYYEPGSGFQPFGKVVSTRQEALREFVDAVSWIEGRIFDAAGIEVFAAALGGVPLGLVVGGRRWWRWLKTGSTAAR